MRQQQVAVSPKANDAIKEAERIAANLRADGNVVEVSPPYEVGSGRKAGFQAVTLTISDAPVVIPETTNVVEVTETETGIETGVAYAADLITNDIETIRVPRGVRFFGQKES